MPHQSLSGFVIVLRQPQQQVVTTTIRDEPHYGI